GIGGSAWPSPRTAWPSNSTNSAATGLCERGDRTAVCGFRYIAPRPPSRKISLRDLYRAPADVPPKANLIHPNAKARRLDAGARRIDIASGGDSRPQCPGRGHPKLAQDMRIDLAHGVEQIVLSRKRTAAHRE